MSHDTPRSGQAPTLEMVAARAGVSRATVSRVVNGSDKVTPEITALVEKAISELDYVPNRAARMLASRRTLTIALVVPETTARVFADPFFASVVQGIALHLADTEFTLTMLFASETHADKTRRYLLGGNVDGALVVSHHSGDHSYARLSNQLPIVFGGRPLRDDERDSYYVDIDNVAGARAATDHLVSLGRTRIATIAGPQDMPPGVDRLAGWKQSLASHGLDDSLVEHGDFSAASGADAMRRLLERTGAAGASGSSRASSAGSSGSAHPDAIFVANDQMAAGAYSVLHEHGLSIPRDVAVVGFDDDPFATTATPALTTVHQPSIQLGATMAMTLVSLIEGAAAARVTLMPTELVVRASA